MGELSDCVMNEFPNIHEKGRGVKGKSSTWVIIFDIYTFSPFILYAPLFSLRLWIFLNSFSLFDFSVLSKLLSLPSCACVFQSYFLYAHPFCVEIAHIDFWLKSYSLRQYMIYWFLNKISIFISIITLWIIAILIKGEGKSISDKR